MKCDKEKFYAVNRYLSSSFRHLGRLIGRHPLYFVIIPFLFTTLAAFGLLRLQVNNDTEYLFLPPYGRTLKARSDIEKLFPENATDFDFTRMTRYKGLNIIIATRKDEGTMMREYVFDELQMLNEKILNAKIKWNGQNITYPLEMNSSHINMDAIDLGGVSTDENCFITEFKAVRLLYFVDYHNSSKQDFANKLEEEIFKIVSQNSFHHIRVSLLNSVSIDSEIDNIFENIVWHIIIGGTSMITFVSVTCLTKDWVTSKPLIGISGCISSTFAVITASGLLLLCGMKYTGGNTIIPFIVV
ncbi:patched domain-containing protein 1-like, partial [Centruroides sculpturatus]|uniref:patched domain-containing protein 1-like n=1 Tax=Centruroides sculpturatus TaxID=218467 RepID=UPI000C6E0953